MGKEIKNMEGKDEISFHAFVDPKNRKEEKYENHRKKHSIQKWAKKSVKKFFVIKNKIILFFIFLLFIEDARLYMYFI